MAENCLGERVLVWVVFEGGFLMFDDSGEFWGIGVGVGADAMEEMGVESTVSDMEPPL